MEKPLPQHKFSDYFYNRTTYLGLYLSFFVFLIELILFGIDFFNKHHSVYLGIITYVVLPPFLILGLLLIPIGALRRRRSVLKGVETERRTPIYVNFNNPKHRNAFVIFVAGTMVLIIMSAVGSYQAFHYTESVHFCGITCHDVMEPQYTRYLQSPHARVKCVECHIGAGADWYVRSKLSGVRQVFATLGKTYPRPIPNPVHNLRPAKETCEQCHWPGKSYGTLERYHQYFLTEAEGPQQWLLRMVLKVGDKDRTGSGIHAHMYSDNDIYYVAEDEQRQKIVWVRSVDREGKETVYTPPDSPYAGKNPPSEMIRKMDCIDCHNRPTHKFIAPYRLVNAALAAGEIDHAIPAIKEKVMEALSGEYATVQEAQESIQRTLTVYYQEALGESYSAYQQGIERAIERTKVIYKHNFFPAMKARWDKYPNNIGHLISPGCFRCHGGEHASAAGKVIPRDCTTCHLIVEQGSPGAVEKDSNGLPFRHPSDISDVWQEMNCFECHTGN